MGVMDEENAAARAEKARKAVEVRGNAKMVFLGRVCGYLLKILGWTLRVRVEDEEGLLTSVADAEGPCVAASWHSSILINVLSAKSLGFSRKTVILISASKDGAVLESFAAVFGLSAVRGSSSRRSRAVLMASLRTLKNGVNIGITPDGPRGPRYVVQPGMVKLAQLSGVPIIVIRSRCSWEWCLKTWDHFRIPLPFSKVVFTIEGALDVPRQLSESEFENVRLEVQRLLRKGLDASELTINDEH